MKTSAFLAAILGVTLVSETRAQYEPLVDGVSAIEAGIGAVPGSLYASTAEWACIASGDEDTKFPHAVVMAREIDAGAAVAYGHPGFWTKLDRFDNSAHVLNTIQWLDRLGTARVAYSSGHGESLRASDLGPLAVLLSANGYVLEQLPAPLTSASLAPYSVLIIGGGSGATPFTEEELDSLDTWLRAGGGVVLTGLGWAYVSYNGQGLPIYEYPMNYLGLQYGLQWLTGYVTDPTDPPEDGVVFDVLYPHAEQLQLPEAISRIYNAHLTDLSLLMGELEALPDVQRSFVRAHQVLAIPTREFAPDHPDRGTVFSVSADLVQQVPGLYARLGPIDENTFPASAWIRERFWKTWADALPLDLSVIETMISLGNLHGTRADAFRDFQTLYLDNSRLSQAQMQYLYDLKDAVPEPLALPGSISVTSFLGPAPSGLDLKGGRPGVNTFSTPIGTSPQNQFPPDVEPGITGSFCSASAHEVNHTVDSQSINKDADLRDRKLTLIAEAGDAHMNYLRSMLPDSFFTNAPQEFFASIANEWFTDSGKTIDLGLIRFDASYPDPINQARFFADVYSVGGDWVPLYLIGLDAVVHRRWAHVDRNAAGRIHRIAFHHRDIEFSLDVDDHVTAYVEAPWTTCERADLTTAGAASGDAGFEVPDGELTAADLQLFVNRWLHHDGRADLTTQNAPDGDPAYGVPDGVISAIDLQFYVNLWVAQCP